jgi:hypothetical protein
MSLSPFEFLKTINRSKENLLDNGADAKDYRPFLINRSLSFRIDALTPAAMMNEMHHIDPDQQYAFMLATVPAAKGYTPWIKAEKPPPELDMVKEYFGYNDARALEVLPILSKAQLEQIEKALDRGGKR